MKISKEQYKKAIMWVRMIARALSVAIIGLEVLFLIGEGIYPSTLNEWLGFLFFPIGITVGMIIAWWNEGLGGTITVGSLVLFYVIYLITSQTFPGGLGWLTFSIPGFIFLIYWYLIKFRS